MEQSGFASAVRKYLSIQGETPGQLLGELKKLDDSDRAYFAAEFLKLGIEITPAK